MKKFTKLSYIAAIALAGLFTTACNKSQDTVTEAAKETVQTLREQSLGVMAADPLVKQYLQENENYLGTYIKWRNNLSPAESQQYQLQCAEALRTGKLLKNPAFTETQVKLHIDTQAENLKTILAKYPQFSTVTGKEIRAMLGSDNATPKGRVAALCSDEYRSCRANGNSENACWAGLESCMNTTY